MKKKSKMNLINDKRGFGMILFIFLAMLVFLVLIFIFKNKLVELFTAFSGIAELTKSKVFWVILVVTLAIIFRKFVEQVLMIILNFIRGIFKI